MTLMRLFKNTLIILVTLLSLSANAADWQLDPTQSVISFVSIKRSNLGEVHTFTDFSGTIKNQHALLSIHTDSIDSNIPIRNQRMRDFLFKTSIYPTIEVSADITDHIKNLKPGGLTRIEVPAMLSLHGIDKEISLDAFISKNNQQQITVISAKPIIIKAARFNMKGGIETLSNLVNNIAISKTVPVSFVLTFNKVAQ